MRKEADALKDRWLIRALTLALAAGLCLPFLTRLFTPPRSGYGAEWRAYLREEKNSADVLFVGTSLVYCDVDPAALEAASGLRALDAAGPVLTTPQTVWYARQALKTQSPRVLMVDINSVYAQPLDQYTLQSVGYMPRGLSRLGCVLTAAPVRLWTELFFPMTRFHSRWDSLTAQDIQNALAPAAVGARGYTRLDGVWTPEAGEPEARAVYAENYEKNLESLETLCALCRARDIRLVFYYSPGWSLYPANAMRTLWDELALRCPEAVCADFSVLSAEMGIDPAADYYDSHHLNAAGAQKFSAWLGAWLTENFEFGQGA